MGGGLVVAVAAGILAAAGSIVGSPIIGGAAAILGAAGLIGGALAVIKSKIATQTIALLKENKAALEDRMADLERQNALFKASNEVQSQRITMLEGMVSGTKAVEDLGKVLAAQHQQLLAEIRAGKVQP